MCSYEWKKDINDWERKRKAMARKLLIEDESTAGENYESLTKNDNI